jgi:hypothetical protein
MTPVDARAFAADIARAEETNERRDSQGDTDDVEDPIDES